MQSKSFSRDVAYVSPKGCSSLEGVTYSWIAYSR